MADELAAPPAGGAGAAGLRRLASLLAVPDYRAVWAAGTVGSLIHFTEFLVLGVFVQQQTGSPFLVALMLFAFALPNSLLGAVTGAVAERMDRRTLLLVCLGTMAVVTAAMAVVALSGALELWMVGIAAFLAGVCWTTEYPVRRTLLGEVAGRGRAAAGLSFDIATGTAMVFVGPLLGGLLLRDVGIHGFYMAASVAYVVEFLCIRSVRYKADALTAVHERTWRVIAAGLRHLRENPTVAGVLAATVVLNFFGFSYTAMLPSIAADKLALGPVGTGMLMSSEGAGALLGLLVISIYADPRGYMRLFVLGCGGILAAILAFSLLPWFVACLVVLFLGGLAQAAFGAMQATIVFEPAPEAMRRRIMGVLVVCFGTAPFGMLHGGLLAEWLGPDRAIGVVALEGAVLFGLCLWRWPALRRRDAPPPPH